MQTKVAHDFLYDPRTNRLCFVIIHKTLGLKQDTKDELKHSACFVSDIDLLFFRVTSRNETCYYEQNYISLITEVLNSANFDNGIS